jgi:hypothetical protein
VQTWRVRCVAAWTMLAQEILHLAKSTTGRTPPPPPTHILSTGSVQNERNIINNTVS